MLFTNTGSLGAFSTTSYTKHETSPAQTSTARAAQDFTPTVQTRQAILLVEEDSHSENDYDRKRSYSADGHIRQGAPRGSSLDVTV